MTDSQFDRETGSIQRMLDKAEQQQPEQPKVVTYQDLIDAHHQAQLDAIDDNAIDHDVYFQHGITYHDCYE